MVSTVAGNVDLEATTTNAGLLAELFDAPTDMPLYSGSTRPLKGPISDAEPFHGDDGLGGARAELIAAGLVARKSRKGAVRQIVSAARELGSALTIVALGQIGRAHV